MGLKVKRPALEGGGPAGGGSPPDGHGSELRCACGTLLARVVARFVELKCRRCKRIWRIPVDAGP